VGQDAEVRVVVAPDCFTGTLTAAEAASAMAAGWRRVRADDEVVVVPLSDGGPGFLDALPGTTVTTLVEDPLGRPSLASFVLDGTTAYVESAQAAGLHLLDPSDRDPRVTSTYGVGQLVLAASEAGAERVVVGLGGSATNDGGAGLLAALGLRAEDASGRDLPPGGLALGQAVRLTGTPLVGAGDGSARRRSVTTPDTSQEVALVVATDVDSPLTGPQGASRVFGPQKGATAEQVEALDASLERWADLVEAHLRVRVRELPGAGAAGGLGFALLALGASRVRGFDVVAAATGLSDLVATADLVLTGEGSLDGPSVQGKVVGSVASLAQEHGVPCVAIAGRVLLGRREAGAAGLAETWSLVDHAGERALAEAAAVVSEVAERVARAWGVAQ